MLFKTSRLPPLRLIFFYLAFDQRNSREPMEPSTSEKKINCSRKAVCISVLVVLILGGGAGGLAYWLTRPEDIPITTAASNAQSPPSLVQASEGGAVRVDSSFLLVDPSNVTHYLTIDNATLSSLTDDTIALYFVPNLDAVDFEASDENFIVPEIKRLDYPHALASSFDPSLYQGGVFGTSSDEGVMVVDMFDWIVDTTSASKDDENDNMGANSTIPGTTAPGDDKSTTTAPTLAPNPSPTLSPTTAAPVPQPTLSPTIAQEDDSITNATAAPGGDESTTDTVATNAPVPSPTRSPPTAAPVPPPTRSPTTAAPVPQPTLSPTIAPDDPIILFSELGGGGYNVGGTITLQYRADIDNNGNVINVPFLLFDNINPVSAPGPFLWMTRRANTQHSQILEDDIYIAIDGTQDGSFTKGGTYALDFPEPNVDFSEFVGGSYIVWCEPFSVWIGGGEIVELQ
jgi:hypothetical protein